MFRHRLNKKEPNKQNNGHLLFVPRISKIILFSIVLMYIYFIQTRRYGYDIGIYGCNTNETGIKYDRIYCYCCWIVNRWIRLQESNKIIFVDRIGSNSIIFKDNTIQRDIHPLALTIHHEGGKTSHFLSGFFFSQRLRYV